MKAVHVAVAASLALVLHGTAPSAAADTVPAHHVRGTLDAVSDRQLTVKTAGGMSVDVPIDAKTKIIGVVPGALADITSGTFIGTANVPDGSSTSTRALEVVVFPQSMAGAGEGDYPWDLPAGKRQSTMTNGTVQASSLGGSMMTNGTVTGVNDRDVKTVTLEYKGGSKRVTIPSGVPIVRIVPGSRSLLVDGAHVVVFPDAGGGAAPRVVVGVRGTVPPL
jgi:hypothetical protein